MTSYFCVAREHVGATPGSTGMYMSFETRWIPRIPESQLDALLYGAQLLDAAEKGDNAAIDKLLSKWFSKPNVNATKKNVRPPVAPSLF